MVTQCLWNQQRFCTLSQFSLCYFVSQCLIQYGSCYQENLWAYTYRWPQPSLQSPIPPPPINEYITVTKQADHKIMIFIKDPQELRASRPF